MNTNMLKMALVAALALTSLGDALTLRTMAQDECQTALEDCHKFCKEEAKD